MQDLEPRCLLSGTAVTDSSQASLEPLSPIPFTADPGLVQLATVDVSNPGVSQQSQIIYGPFWMPTGVDVSPSSQTPTEDLYDEGAGAVWGSLSDEGGPRQNTIVDSEATVGATGIDDLLQDFGAVATGDGGTAAAVGDFGIDDVGEEYSTTGGTVIGLDDVADYGNIWGTIADEGVYGTIIGCDDVVDYGGTYAAAVGDFGLDDVADYGAVDESVTGGNAVGGGVGYEPADYGGAVMGTIADEGVDGTVIGLDDVVDYGGTYAAAVGDFGLDDVGEEYNATGGVGYEPADYGGAYAAAVGDFGLDDVGEDYNATGGVGYEPADYGGAYAAAVGDFGLDDVGEDYNATGGVGYEPADYGGAVWGTIADEGVFGGVDDVADYGAAAIGGLDDVADYGAVIGTPADGGIDSGIGVNGIDGDYGAAAYGPGDYGIGADDYGIGAGAYGTNDTGAGDSPTGDDGPGDYGAGAYGPGDYGAGDNGAGPGDYGTNDTGTIGALDGDYGAGAGDFSGDSDGTTVGAAADGGTDDTISLEILDSEASELHPGNTPNGATFRLTRTSTDSVLSPFVISVKVGGSASFGGDYSIDGITWSYTLTGTMIYVMMGSDQSSLDVHLTVLNDAEFEDPETVLLTLAPSTFGDYLVSDETERKINITDETADLDITSVGVGILKESAESFPGADLRLNNNDDNQDGRPDLIDDGSIQSQFHDPDLQPLTIRRLFPLEGTVQFGYFKLSFDPAIVKVWQSPDKSTIGSGSTEREVVPGVTVLRESANDFIFWVEGVGEGSTNITLTHDVLIYGSRQFDSLRVTVWNVDLDIDSDNDNGNGQPERSAWEEELEDHSHAIGKMLFHPDNTYVPVPILLNLPSSAWHTIPGSSIDYYQLRLDFQNNGQSGGIKLTALDWQGHEFLVSAGDAYPLSQFHIVSGQIVLRLYSTSVKTAHSTKIGVQTNGKPDDRVKATITRDGADLFQDEVKYMVVQPDTFYPHLDHSRFVRDGMASEGVYKAGAAADLPEFALKKLTRSEMELLFKKLKLDERSELYDLLLTELPSGYKGVLYRDYVDGEYVLTFAGTDDLQDVVDDAVQSTGLFVTQYQNAMRAAFLMGPLFNGNLRTTGHSLGGGLASAASVVGNIPANTWNAAGLPRATLYKHEPVYGLPVPGTEMYAGSLARYDNFAESLITARYLDWDLLSLVQDLTPVVAPSAIGTRIKMDGPVDRIVAESINSAALGVLMFGLDTNPVASPFDFLKTALGDGFTALLNCHKTQYYHYGFLVREDIFGNVIWDIYDDDFYGNDSHDQ